MDNEIISKVDEYVQAIADTLGVAAEHVYGVLITQTLMKGVLMTSVGGLFLVIAISLAWITYGIFVKSEYEEEETRHRRAVGPLNNYARMRESYFVRNGDFGTMATIVWVICAVVIFMTIPGGILRIANPEYYAIKEILSVFSK